MAELKKNLIAIVGPTAIGKTSLSIHLAKKLNCPILSADSRQFYQEMSIGTAKPTEEELAAAQHYFIDSRSIHDFYTAGMYEEDGMQQLSEIYKNHDQCILVGGSGLYVNALCFGIDDIPTNTKIRASIQKRWKAEGLQSLVDELKEIDFDYFELGDMKNPRRVMRALEVYHTTGRTYTSFRKANKKERPFTIKWIGLELDLPALYTRINARVDQMLEQGLIEEVKQLHQFADCKALQSVGYQELIEHFNGAYDLEEAIRLIKRNSRRFARRQYTWFRKNNEIKWFKPSDREAIDAYIAVNK